MRHDYEWREGVGSLTSIDCIVCGRALTNGHLSLYDRFSVGKDKRIAFYYYCISCGEVERARQVEREQLRQAHLAVRFAI